MPRYRQGEARWVHAACVAGAYLVFVATLFTLQLGAGLSLPVPLAVAAPPLVYAALAMLLLREASFVRRFSWLGSACVVHLVLGALAATELTWAGGLSLPAAFAQVFVLFPPAPALTLVATPLTLAAFGLTAPRPTRRADASARPLAPVRAKVPVPTARATRSASDAATAAVPTPRVATATFGGFAAPVPPSSAPVSPPAVPTAAVAAPAPPEPAPVVPVLPTAAPAVARPSKAARRADDGMVRVSFARIAAQLPAGAFVLPFERLGESLREPHLVLVPRRVVLSQMRDGAVAITWAHISSQFPDLALGMSDDEFRKQYPDLQLWLPMDEIVSQLPAGSVPGAPAPEPDRVETPLTMPSNGAPTAAIVPAPISAPVPAAAVPPISAPVPAAAVPPISAPVPAAAARPLSMAVPATAAPRRTELPGREVTSQIAACFSAAGTFEVIADHILDSVVVTLVEPTLAREAVTTAAAPLLRALANASADVITLRTEHAVVVLGVAATPIVVAAPMPGAPVALLALCAARAAAAVGDGAPSVPSPAPRALEPVSVEPRVVAAARALRSLGAVQPTVFADGSARIYVVSADGGEDKAVALLALNVCDALGDGGDLGRPHAVVFRRGTTYTLVRPLAGSVGVLAATGVLTRPGRLLREADRAAAVLEAR